MGELVIQESAESVQRIERFQSLNAGRYWRALKDVREQGIDKDEVLLLQSIRYVDDKPHTIILRPHPTKLGEYFESTTTSEDGTIRTSHHKYTEHRFLVQEFLDTFVFEPNHEEVRRGELAKIQGRVAELQMELLTAQKDSTKLARIVDEGLKEEAKNARRKAEQYGDFDKKVKTESTSSLPALPQGQLVAMAQGSIADALSGGITEGTIEQLKVAASKEHSIATVKANWIKAKTSEIGETLKAMAPFYEEQAAAALAMTEDTQAYVKKIMQGIASLDLYVGKNVSVTQWMKGADAPDDEPLTFVQRKLIMDEELAVFEDVDEQFDFQGHEKFAEALNKHPGLVAQIFPTRRCVLVMATTHRFIDYGDGWSTAAKNEENKNVFILVRNGDNIHQVYSPVESHLRAASLFPSKDQQARVFRGIDGNEVRFEDIAYTDKLSDHENFALHYKRFLLLACGLDHRLNLFGTFYPGPKTLEFVSLAFQEKYCRFLFDGGNVLAQARRPLSEWLTEKNAYLRSGSRVLVNWRNSMNPHSAPAACKKEESRRDNYSNSFRRPYVPENKNDIVIAAKEGEDIVVSVQVRGYIRGGLSNDIRKFQCKVNLTKVSQGSDYSRDELSYLCLDAVTPEEIKGYINSRAERRDHIYYIRFFKQALRFLENERQGERVARQALRQALSEGKIAQGAQSEALIEQSVIAWRAANRGAPLPSFKSETPQAHELARKEWRELLDQMYMLAKSGKSEIQKVESMLAATGYAPLRLVLSGSAKRLVYAAPKLEELDERVSAHVWVHRFTLGSAKNGDLKVKAETWALLPKTSASETTVHEWPDAAKWAGRTSGFPSYDARAKVIQGVLDAVEDKSVFEQLAKPMTEESFEWMFNQWHKARMRMLGHATHVTNPQLAIPIGISVNTRTQKFSYLCAASAVPHALLYTLAPNDAWRKRIKKEYVGVYRNSTRASERFDEEVEQDSFWELKYVGASFPTNNVNGFFDADKVGTSYEHSRFGVTDFRLSSAYKRLLADKDEKTQLWVAPALLNGDKLIVDKLLNIKLPANFKPVQTSEVRVHGDTNDKAPEGHHWCDIYEERYEDAHTQSLEVARKFFKSSGYSSSGNKYSSPEVARERLKRNTAKLGLKAVEATQRPDLPQPPDGVERWFLI